MKKLLIPIFLMIFVISLQAQKKPIDHSVYDSWKSIAGQNGPYNGKFFLYSVNAQEGDNTLVLFNIENEKEVNFERGENGVVNSTGDYMVYRIKPFFQETRQARIKKKKREEMPQDTLAVYNILTGEITKFSHLKSYKVPQVLDGIVAFQENAKPVQKQNSEAEKPNRRAETGEKEMTEGQKPAAEGQNTVQDDKKPAPMKEDKSAASSLLLLDIRTSLIDTIKYVESYFFNDNGDKLIYITKPNKYDTLAFRGIYMYDLKGKNTTEILTGDMKAKFALPSLSEDGNTMVFYAQLDTTKEALKYVDIYKYNLAGNVEAGVNPRVIINKQSKGLNEGWMIADNIAPSFNESGNMMFIGTRPIPPEKDTSLVDFETAKLDIWTWNEDYLPTVQLLAVQREGRRSYRAIVYMDNFTGEIIQIADEDIPGVAISQRQTPSKVLAMSDKPYRIQSQWDRDPITDIYEIDLKTGNRKLLFEAVPVSNIASSPYGNYYVWFNAEEQEWFLYDMSNGKLTNITGDLDVEFWNIDTDTPSQPRAYCMRPMWFADESAFVINDRYDYWQFDPAGSKTPFMLTDGYGRENRVSLTINSFLRPFKVKREFEDNHLNRKEPLYFSGFNEVTKMNGFYVKEIDKPRSKVVKLIEAPYTFVRPALTLRFDNYAKKIGRDGKAAYTHSSKKLPAPVFLYVKSNFENSPDIYITKNKFVTEKRLSDINPQQKDYNWGTVELVSWEIDPNINIEGVDFPVRAGEQSQKIERGEQERIKVEGLLYKPEDFNPAKKYPMIIYFYEKVSNGLYNYRTPAPSRSTVNISYFVSNGYLVFTPDIYYADGYPGPSAMHSIMPGVEMLCKNSWVDEDHMAIQGQSWGGYQVAYMITQTDKFAAAGAGAPVSNMTSAYGGIRWGSGVTRQFQYEQQQSRIGTDLWNGFDMYIHNSPLFFLPNVKTPLLIMHNDKDDAVPWWQGIELYVGLRRLGKPVWMLQYNDELHNLRDRRNAKDLSIRLEQFFGHYLKGAPMPVWMEKGIPANLKGIDFGFSLGTEDFAK